MAEPTISARRGTDSAEQTKPRRPRITKRKALENHARSYFDALARRDAAAMAEHWQRGRRRRPRAARHHARPRRDPGLLPASCSPPCPTSRPRSRAWSPGQAEVAVAWRMTGTFSGAPFQGVEPTGTRDRAARDRPDRGRGRQERHATRPTTTAWRSRASVGLLPAQDSGAERAMKSAFNAATRVRRVVTEGRDALAREAPA